MSMSYGSCGMCQFCHQFVGTGAGNKRVTAYYCRKNAPVASQTAAIAMSDAMIIMKGIWPSVDPNRDGCAEFVESTFQ